MNRESRKIAYQICDALTDKCLLDNEDQEEAVELIAPFVPTIAVEEYLKSQEIEKQMQVTVVPDTPKQKRNKLVRKAYLMGLWCRNLEEAIRNLPVAQSDDKEGAEEA